MKIKIASILVLSALVDSSTFAYNVAFKEGDHRPNTFHCTVANRTIDQETLLNTFINITTSQIKVRGLCPNSTSQLGGTVSGSGGQLNSMPLCKKDKFTGNVKCIDNFYFAVERQSRFNWKGSVDIGTSEVNCEYGQGDATEAFGNSNDYC